MLSFLLIAFFFYPKSVWADITGVSITPMSLDQQGISGQMIKVSAKQASHRLTFSLTNYSEAPVHLIVSGSSAATNATGELIYQQNVQSFGKAPFLLESIIPTKSFLLPAKKTRALTIDMKLPKTNFGGEVGGAIVFSSSKETTFIPLVVQGKELHSVKPLILATLGGTLLSEMPALTIQIENQNPLFLDNEVIDLTLSHQRFWGLQKTTYHFQQQNNHFAPNQAMRAAISLQGKPLLAGKYHITGTIQGKSTTQTIDQDLTLSSATVEKINQQAGIIHHDPMIWLLSAVVVLLVLIGWAVRLIWLQNHKKQSKFRRNKK